MIRISWTQAYFLVNKRRRVGRKPQSIETVQSVEYVVDISRPHVLGGVDTEPCDTHVDEMAHVVGDPVSYPLSIALQVSQADETTITHLNCIVVILYRIIDMPLPRKHSPDGATTDS